MTKFVLLFKGGGMPETEEETAAVMKAWENWYVGLAEAVVDGGNPFTPAAKSIASDGSVSDGSVLGLASGYAILQASSLDEAAKLAKGCPILSAGGEIAIFETFEVM